MARHAGPGLRRERTGRQLLCGGRRWLGLRFPLVLLGDPRPFATLVLPALGLTGGRAGGCFAGLSSFGTDRIRRLQQMLHAGDGQLAFGYLGAHDLHGSTEG